jgi:uncharacterized RDD family membrane protein YckC
MTRFPLVLRRLAAYFVDIVLLYAVLAGGLQLVSSTLLGIPDWASLAQHPVRLEAWVLLSISLPTWVYFIYCDTHGGATLGKRLLGLHTTTLSANPVSTGQAVLRTALKLLPWELTHFSVLVPNPLWNPGAEAAVSQTVGITLANILMLGYLVVLAFQQGKRSLHDLAAGTMVTPV